MEEQEIEEVIGRTPKKRGRKPQKGPASCLRKIFVTPPHCPGKGAGSG